MVVVGVLAHSGELVPGRRHKFKSICDDVSMGVVGHYLHLVHQEDMIEVVFLLDGLLHPVVTGLCTVLAFHVLLRGEVFCPFNLHKKMWDSKDLAKVSGTILVHQLSGKHQGTPLVGVLEQNDIRRIQQDVLVLYHSGVIDSGVEAPSGAVYHPVPL